MASMRDNFRSMGGREDRGGGVGEGVGPERATREVGLRGSGQTREAARKAVVLRGRGRDRQQCSVSCGSGGKVTRSACTRTERSSTHVVCPWAGVRSVPGLLVTFAPERSAACRGSRAPRTSTSQRTRRGGSPRGVGRRDRRWRQADSVSGVVAASGEAAAGKQTAGRSGGGRARRPRPQATACAE